MFRWLTSGTARGVQGQHSLDGHIHGWDVEGLKHDLGHLLSVGLGVEWGLCEQGGVLLGCHTQLIVEGVMPDLLHIIPVGDDTVLNGVLQSQDTSLALSLISYVGVLLSHTDHHTLEEEAERQIVGIVTTALYKTNICSNCKYQLLFEMKNL